MPSRVMDENFKVEVPAEVRQKLNLEPGHEIGWLEVGDTYRMVRVRTLQELRGTLKGMDWSDYRDETDRPL